MKSVSPALAGGASAQCANEAYARPDPLDEKPKRIHLLTQVVLTRRPTKGEFTTVSVKINHLK